MASKQSGKPGPERKDMKDQIVGWLREHTVPFMGTGQLADKADMTNPGITKHLKRAHEAGVVGKTEISGYNVWYLPEIEQSKPGRPRKEVTGDIVSLLRETDNRAMTLGEITAEVDAARRTVKDRLDDLVELDTLDDGPGRIAHQQIGNATAYWYEREGHEV